MRLTRLADQKPASILPRMKPTWKTLLLATAKFIVPVLIIGYLLWRIEPKVWAQLSARPKDYWLLAFALAVALAATSLSFVRWCVLVRAQEIRLSMVEALRLGAIGYLLSFVSVGSVGGDLFKAIFLAQRRPGKRLEAVASILVDRGCGLYALLVLAGAALLLSNPSEVNGGGAETLASIEVVTVVLVATGTVILLVLVLGGKGVDRLIRWGSTWSLVGRPIERLGPPLRMFHTHPIAFAAAIGMSLGVQSMLAISMYLIARGLYSSPPTLMDHFIIVPIGMLTSALPITPAGLGVLEATLEWLYQIVPSTPTLASGTLVALVFELVKVAMAAMGVVFYWTAGEEVRHSIEIAEERELSQELEQAEDGPSKSPDARTAGIARERRRVVLRGQRWYPERD